VVVSFWSRVREALAVPGLNATAYDAATQGYRARALMAPGYGPNAAIASAGDLPRRRTEALARNSPWAHSILESFTADVVGTGVQPQSQHPDRAWRPKINALFADFVEQSDADGICDFYGQQWVAAMEVRQGGDCLALKRPRLKDDVDTEGMPLAVPLQIQLLSGRFLPYWKTELSLKNGNRIICGIEYGPIGRPVAYHLLKEDPGELNPQGSTGETVRVDAARVIHMFRRKMAGQVRGEWALVRAILRLNDLDEYEAAELFRKKGAAMFGGIIKATDPTQVAEMFGGSMQLSNADGSTMTLNDAMARLAQIEMTPGTWPIVLPGFEIENFQPADVGPNFEPFIRHHLRAAAQAGDVTYEQVTGDMTGVNYSSARVAQQNQFRRLEPWQWQVIVFQFCRPVWNAFLARAVATVPEFAALPGYAQDRRAAHRVTWHPQGRPFINPVDELTAEVIAVRAGFKSKSQVIREMGFDPEVIEREIEDENKRADAAGRIHDTDPRKVTQTGIAVSVGSARGEGPQPPQRSAGGARG
jgi:lambda family phage portal protein